jgi:DNA repair protein RadD
MIKLRSYQGDAVAKIRDCFVRLINAVLLVLPTGGGKTVVFTFMSQQAALKDKKTLILVHRIELLRQTSKALLEFGVEHGMINPLFTPNFDTLVQVASVQTIIKRLNYFAATNWIPDVIIVDEAHHATAGSWRKIIAHFKELNPNLRVIGVTATPIRTDGQGLGIKHDGIFEELVSGPSVKWLQDEGFLVKAKVLSPPKQFDASKLKRKKGDYNARDLENLINKPTITGDAVDHYEQVCKGTPAIVFCVSVKHTEEVAQAFRDRGYKFYAIDGTTDDDVRKRILNGLADGSVHGVTSCDLINEGTDVPAATTAMLLRFTQSLSLHLQQIGRVLRPIYAPGYDLTTREGRLAAIAASNKPWAYVLDHVGNVGNWVDGQFIENHGLPDKLHEWSLDGEVKRGGKKGPRDLLTRVQQCLSCFAVHEPAPVCPDCGHVYEVKDTTPKQVEGELLEIDPETLKAVKKEQKLELVKSESLEDLQRIAMERGYSEGWIGIQYKMRKPKFEAVARRKAEREAKEATAPPMPVHAGDWDEDLDF